MKSNEIIYSIYKEELKYKLESKDWQSLERKYKNFLENIPLKDYRKKLQQIKTIEFDLSGKYRSIHLSLIYYFYLKEKNIVFLKDDCEAYKYLKNKKFQKLLQVFCDRNDNSIPIFEFLDNEIFKKEEDILNFIYEEVGRKNQKLKVKDIFNISHDYPNEEYDFPGFEDFFKIYIRSINVDDFIQQHKSYINFDLIKKEMESILSNHKKILNINEDIDLSEVDYILKLYILAGLKARLYRTWTALLTQIDFVYTWNRYIPDIKVDSDAILDIKGIDIYCIINDKKIGFQIKKSSQRHEARRDTQNSSKNKDILIVDINYDIDPKNNEELKDLLDVLDNGFVVFNKNYVRKIYERLINAL